MPGFCVLGLQKAKLNEIVAQPGVPEPCADTRHHERYLAGWNACREAMLAAVPTASPSSYSNNSNNCTEALKWTAAAFRAFAKIQRAKESDRIELDDGSLKSIGEILDMANAALEQKS